MGMKETNCSQETIESPTYWFAVFESALRANNFDLAAEAKRHLEQLGVRVVLNCFLPAATAPAKKVSP